MTRRTREALEQALGLTSKERGALVRQLIASLEERLPEEDEAEVAAAWAKKIERRAREEPPPGKSFPTAEEVLARGRRQVRAIRRSRRGSG